MNSIVYPLDETKSVYDDIKSSFTEENFVKINTFGDNNCVYDSFLMAVHRNYQDKDNNEMREKIRNEFVLQFKKYMISDSEATMGEIYEKVFEAFKLSDMKENYMLKSRSKDHNIFNLVIIKKSEDQLKGYPLFSKNVKKYFSPTSNLFNLISLDFLKEIIDQRIVKKNYCQKLETSDNKKELQEIIDFINSKENSLDPVNFLSIVTLKDCSDQDLVLKLISENLNVNIFLCRAWSNEFTVLKKYFKDKEDPYLIIFKTEGKVSLTGMEKKKFYEAGGIKYEKWIKTILNPKKDRSAIETLEKIYRNNIDSYYLEKYLNYLNNISQRSNLQNLEDFYDDQEMEEEEMEEEEMGEEEMGEEEMEEEVSSDTPIFVKKYSKEELKNLLNKYVDEDMDYSRKSKSQLENIYNNYLKKEMNMDLDMIQKRLENRFV